ncbi:hypothetical protein Bbelb_062520 [Branchiostoma belcheri]|nr:hypothetical protein Bbelb_062520 [Branchiostoma belcheri]
MAVNDSELRVSHQQVVVTCECRRYVLIEHYGAISHQQAPGRCSDLGMIDATRQEGSADIDLLQDPCRLEFTVDLADLSCPDEGNATVYRFANNYRKLWN